MEMPGRGMGAGRAEKAGEAKSAGQPLHLRNYSVAGDADHDGSERPGNSNRFGHSKPGVGNMLEYR